MFQLLGCQQKPGNKKPESFYLAKPAAEFYVYTNILRYIAKYSDYLYFWRIAGQHGRRATRMKRQTPTDYFIP